MNARQRQVEDIVGGAVELAAAERAGYVDQACGRDSELRAEVEALLAAAVGATARLRGVVERAAVDLVARVPVSGRRLGPYRLVKELGQGGMGAVYLAVRDDDQYRAEVAIKLLHQGLETAAAVARFRDERQILAGLDHPGIVRLLDGGSTADGLPYLVMERVDGVPITVWAREKNLSVRARVQLFRTVCDAVTFAHQRLVVHRDLKPSNILVTADGQPKLLDFGIAKLLGGDDAAAREARTGTGALLLTPAYASPEQLRGQAVSTASDIYSLGAVLYELLAEVRAFAVNGGSLDALRAVLEADPARPSAVAPSARRGALAGDLDNIVLKALAKEPNRRYASVEQLQADLGRYLDGLPVEARAGTFGYRAGKFVRRNRGAIVAAIVVVTALSSATVVSLRQAQRADEQARRADGEARRARQSFDDVRQLTNSILFEVDEKIRDLAGATGARELIVSRALEYLDRLAAQAADDTAVARDLATAYMKIGDIQGNMNGPNLGRPRDGIESYRRAKQILDRLAAAGQLDDEIRFEQARVRFGMGFLARWAENDEAAARAAITEALAIAESLPRHPGFDYRMVIQGDIVLYRMDLNDGNLAEAEQRASAGHQLATEWARGENGAEARYFIAVTRDTLARVRMASGDPETAVAYLRDSVRDFDALSAEHPENAPYRRELYTALMFLGTALYGTGDTVIWQPNLGDRDAAEEALRRGLALAEESEANDQSDNRRLLDLVNHLSGLGAVVADYDPARGVAMLERARAYCENLPAETRRSAYSRQNEWYTHCALGEPLARLGRRGEAISEIESGLEMAEQLATHQAKSDTEELYLAMCRYQAARARWRLGDVAAAAELADRLATDLDAFIARRPDGIVARIGLGDVLDLLAQLRPEQRCQLAGRSAAAWSAWPGKPTDFTQRRQTQLEAALSRCRGPVSRPATDR